MTDIEKRVSQLECHVKDMSEMLRSLLQMFDGALEAHEARMKQTIPTDDLEVVQSATGIYYVPKHADADIIVQAIKSDKIFEENVYNVAQRFIKADTIVLDVGSNFGQMAIMMAKHVGNGMVYAFEADDFVYSILEKNVEVNKVRVKPHFGAVHNVSGETLYFPKQDFVRFGTYGSYSIDYVGRTGRPVPTITIDSLEYPLPVSFMKVDVQGGDLFAMQGAIKTIQKYRMPILFEYEKEFEKEQGYSFAEYAKFISDIDYSIVDIIEHNYLVLPR